MSVLIKGIDMPTGNHEIIVRIQSDGRVLDQWGHRLNQEFIAIPVPPHGRLIDADALDDLLMKLADNEYTPKVFASWLSYEENAPTIIPASEEGE